MKRHKRIAICGLILFVLVLGWRLHVARHSIDIDDMLWEDLGHDLSRICYRRETLIGPGDIEIEERRDHVFGMCIDAAGECKCFVIDKKTHQVFTGERYDDLLRKTKGRYPIMEPKRYETFWTRKLKRK